MKKILLVSPNWLGDFVMALPALSRYRAEHPDAAIDVLCKKSVAALWPFVEGVGSVHVLPSGTRETFRMGLRLRAERYDEALLLPNSFRSALIPWLARIPRRRGTAFHARALLVNDKVRFSADEKRLHQTLEYAKILCGSAACEFGKTGFHPAGTESGAASPVVGIVPGAARGNSKRYPFFAEAAQRVARVRPDVRFRILGGPGEAPLCAEVASAIGSAAENMAGKTTLPQFAAALASCACVMCNDSGGMHLASAAGVPVVAVFGCTDPEKTGPIGPGARLVRAEGVRAARAIAREDPVAIAALASIDPARVADAVLACLP